MVHCMSAKEVEGKVSPILAHPTIEGIFGLLFTRFADRTRRRRRKALRLGVKGCPSLSS